MRCYRKCSPPELLYGFGSDGEVSRRLGEGAGLIFVWASSYRPADPLLGRTGAGHIDLGSPGDVTRAIMARCKPTHLVRVDLDTRATSQKSQGWQNMVEDTLQKVRAFLLRNVRNQRLRAYVGRFGDRVIRLVGVVRSYRPS
jgi:hypothetical protein